jgi:uracil-DNA glycosylase
MSSQSLDNSLERLLRQVRSCELCKADLPMGLRPVLRVSTTARILIVGQAPGTRVHETGIPWNDPSGDRLREWMGVGRETFYDESRIAIIPMGYCYPGRNPKGGDLPPRKECAEHWLDALLEHVPQRELTILAGSYAQQHYLGNKVKRTLTETVRAWRDYAPEFIPMPHPSPRNNLWLRRNPWFEKEVVPYLREQVREWI